MDFPGKKVVYPRYLQVTRADFIPNRTHLPCRPKKDAILKGRIRLFYRLHFPGAQDLDLTRAGDEKPLRFEKGGFCRRRIDLQKKQKNG